MKADDTAYTPEKLTAQKDIVRQHNPMSEAMDLGKRLHHYEIVKPFSLKVNRRK